MKKISLFLIILLSFKSYAQSKADAILEIKPSTKPANQFRRFYVPSALIIGGLISEIDFKNSLNFKLYEEINKDIPNFKTSADDYLQYLPVLLAYGFDALGMPSKTDFINRSIILLKSEVLMTGAVTGLKYTIRELRPDSSARNSVPSGHTAQAFAAAAFLSEEYGKKYKWVPYLSYGLASTVGTLRIMNNKHYLSDVLIGAGIGILSTKISYWTHQFKRSKRKKQVLSNFDITNV